MSNSSVAATKAGVAFVPAVLDDFGLNPYEFRLYCRLARRAGSDGQCWESISCMAKGCQMGLGTAKNALKKLRECNMVHQIKRSGQTDIYRLTHPSHWVKPHQQKTELSKYKQFLESSYWKEVRELVLKRDQCCQYCGVMGNLQVHHLTYTHLGKEKEHLEDLVTLCSGCHLETHGEEA